MTPEEKLKLIFAAQRPPARDFAFETRLAERVALRRALAAVLAMAPWAVAAVAVLWAAQPILAELGPSLSSVASPLLPALGLSGATLLLAVLLTRLRPRRA